MAIDFKIYQPNTKFFDNRGVLITKPYEQTNILSHQEYAKAMEEISSWSSYQPTPLHTLIDLARNTGVAQIFYKDESYRFSLKSFKALGGAYAVANLLINELGKIGHRATSRELLNGRYRDITKKITVCCATDGNHGKSVAWGAQMFGCQCEIFIHRDVSQTRENEIAKYGAKICRMAGNYDDSVHDAQHAADVNGYFIVSDTSYSGYTEVPKDVMQGYTIMVAEALAKMPQAPSHIFLQGGVGGLAAAVTAHVLEQFPATPPKIVLVEPNKADCLLQSAKARAPCVVNGSLDTIMAGLACGEVSILAWQILARRVSAFMSIADEPIIDVMRMLAQKKIVGGESACAGLAGFLIAERCPVWRETLGINKQSIVLFFGTEGDTDPSVYQSLVGISATDVLAGQFV